MINGKEEKIFTVHYKKYTKTEVKGLFYTTFGLNDPTTQIGVDIETWIWEYGFSAMLEAVQWESKKQNKGKNFYSMIKELNFPLDEDGGNND